MQTDKSNNYKMTRTLPQFQTFKECQKFPQHLYTKLNACNEITSPSEASNTYIPVPSQKALMFPTLTATSIKKRFLIKTIESSKKQNHKIHKNHYQSTNSITKHRYNQNYSTIKGTINKQYKNSKEINNIKNKLQQQTNYTKKRDVKKRRKQQYKKLTPMQQCKKANQLLLQLD